MYIHTDVRLFAITIQNTYRLKKWSYESKTVRYIETASKDF